MCTCKMTKKLSHIISSEFNWSNFASTKSITQMVFYMLEKKDGDVWVDMGTYIFGWVCRFWLFLES